MDLRSESNLENRLENAIALNAIRKGLNKKFMKNLNLKLLEIAPEILKFAKPVWFKLDEFMENKKKFI